MLKYSSLSWSGEATRHWESWEDRCKGIGDFILKTMTDFRDLVESMGLMCTLLRGMSLSMMSTLQSNNRRGLDYIGDVLGEKSKFMFIHQLRIVCMHASSCIARSLFGSQTPCRQLKLLPLV